MKNSTLISILQELPLDADVRHVCPDGYECSISFAGLSANGDYIRTSSSEYEQVLNRVIAEQVALEMQPRSSDPTAPDINPMEDFEKTYRTKLAEAWKELRSEIETPVPAQKITGG